MRAVAEATRSHRKLAAFGFYRRGPFRIFKLKFHPPEPHFINGMIRRILLVITICLSFSGFSQTLGLKRYKTDTTLIYQKDLKLYEFVLENKKQGLFWDTLKSDAFALSQFKVKNNTGEIIILKNVRQDDGTITFFGDYRTKIIYPDSCIRITMISGKRPGPFTSYVRITYTKGKEDKQSTIPTWGWYGTPYQQGLSNKLPVVPEEKKPAFVPPPIQTIVHEPKPEKRAKEKAPKTVSTDTTAAVSTFTVSAKRDFFITLISGTENITADSYLLINGKKIRSTMYDNDGFCFKLNAKPSDAWPVKIVTKQHGSYNTTIFFNRANFCIRVPNAGEKYHYSGSFIMLNKVHKGYYFIKAPTTNDYKAIKDILEKRHLLVYDIHHKSLSDRINLPSDSAALIFEKELRAKGLNATLEPATEYRDDMWELENGKALNVAKAYILFNPGTTDQWITATLKRFGNVSYAGSRLSDERKEEYGDCPEYHITVHSNLYKEYMAVFDKLWNMKEVKHLEQISNEPADAD